MYYKKRPTVVAVLTVLMIPTILALGMVSPTYVGLVKWTLLALFLGVVLVGGFFD